ncbi:Maltose phosphorylase [Rhodovastum atsumiense]|uniref:Glycoside hydrolase family 65 protein n=1 Tax=Rhodovastum atsumiense TaxID=504468 RepID=A0A5M6J0Z5_9PROT|nr:glycosyl hydrolase family 65 protein [Rhodovastum atsumiense]KAA5614253.1 glycoside hydrolase family 65 protein [Rhodovastum atsumiense]CAH2604703.1 Maltose phosphorylase [Rhodovastum atsumiense]
MERVLEPTADPLWILEEQGHNPLRESGIESRFTIANGFLGVRGARAVSRGPTWVSWLHTLTWSSWPRTYVAGLFDTPDTDPPVPALVPAADWLRVRILVNGAPLLLREGHLLAHERKLDMNRGVMLTEWHQRNSRGVDVWVRTLRLVSLADRAVGLQLLRLELDRDNLDVRLEASFEGAGLGLDPVLVEPDLGIWRTWQSGKTLAMTGAASLHLDGREVMPSLRDHLRWSWNWQSVAGQVVALDRLAAVSRGDSPDGGAGRMAREALERNRAIGWRGVVAAHEAAWATRWECSDIMVEGDDAALRALRFAIYHLNGSANPADERVSIGARALTGDSYLGHVFWDTEIYLVPFYIVTWPEAARALLMYRYHTLGGARAKAVRMGWRGALYAWESADTGEETTPEEIIGPDGQIIRVLCGREEQHISADVAYAVMQYWRASGDDGFLLEAGAEIVLETARFWASRGVKEADGRRHIRGVIGPDEFHETIDDNAYTNIMAQWNIRTALDLAALLRERWPARWAELAGRLGLDDAEFASWREAADTLVTGQLPGVDLIEQFAGFFQLEEVDLAQYAGRTAAMDVLLGRERTKRSQVIKQADVVALLALLPDAFDARTKLANFRYYEPRCGHDSSLSRSMHAVVAARMGDVDMALRYFRATAAIDLEDKAAGSAGGVHIAALGGLWQTAIFGFAGLSLRGEAPAFDPHLPRDWQGLGFGVHWRGRRIRVRIEPDALTATLEAGEQVPILVRGVAHEIPPGETVRIALG